MNIFIRELKAHRKSIIIWCVVIFLFIIAGMGKYVTYSETPEAMNKLMAEMPSTLKAVLGFNNFDPTTPSGFYAMLFSYLVIMATIHASMLGAGIISKEERDKTTEFLMTKPVSRESIITAKLWAAFVNVVIFNVITLVSSIAIVGNYAKGQPIAGDIAVLMVGMFILQLIFLFIGTGIAAVSKRPKTAVAVSAGVMLVTFVLAKITDLSSYLAWLKYLTPFKYYDAGNLMNRDFSPIFIILTMVIIGVALFSTYKFYRSRDLKV